MNSVACQIYSNVCTNTTRTTVSTKLYRLSIISRWLEHHYRLDFDDGNISFKKASLSGALPKKS